MRKGYVFLVVQIQQKQAETKRVENAAYAFLPHCTRRHSLFCCFLGLFVSDPTMQQRSGGIVQCLFVLFCIQFANLYVAVSKSYGVGVSDASRISARFTRSRMLTVENAEPLSIVNGTAPNAEALTVRHLRTSVSSDAVFEGS